MCVKMVMLQKRKGSIRIVLSAEDLSSHNTNSSLIYLYIQSTTIYYFHCFLGDQVCVQLIKSKDDIPLFRVGDRRYHAFTGFLMKPE